MSQLDPLDREMLAILKQDARASITQLAAELGVARATIKSRLSRLSKSGTIRRYTVDLNDPGADDLIHAIMLIQVQGPHTARVTSELLKRSQIIDLHTTNGSWDLVARIETQTLAEFDQILQRVREIPGILNSETCLLLDRAR